MTQTPESTVARSRYERERKARHSAESLLETKSRELYEARTTERRFLARLNHEFRTPLNGILGPAQLLQTERMSAEVRSYGSAIERCGRELMAFLNALLDSAEAAEIEASAAPPRERSDRTVLIVDDNPINRVVARAAAEAVGLQVRLAENGREALEAIAEAPPDIVLMDIQMPVMRGDEAIRAIRSGETPYADLPIVVLTADAEPDGPARYRAIGADAYLTKPVTVTALGATLLGTMKGSGTERRAS